MPQLDDVVQLSDIELGVGSVDEKTALDDKDRLEVTSIDNRKRLAEIGSLEQLIEDKKANRELRAAYANRVYCYLCAYSATCAALVLGCGLGLLTISDVVLTTLVGSTAVAAIGLVGFVVSGLFKPNL
jgi:hypothetical protein